MEKESMIKIVVVKHPGCGTPYTFRVPEFAELSAGDLVYMDTSRGKDQPGRCITSSFYIDMDTLLMGYNTVPEKLKPVKGELFKHEYRTNFTDPLLCEDKPFDAR